MKEKLIKISKQALSFILVSGIGWIFDFTTYLILTNIVNLNVTISNMISAVPALTYVFAMSSKKIFKNDNSKLTLRTKYIIYFVYQIILVSTVSLIAGIMYDYFLKSINISLIIKYLKIFIKILITPVTMLLNFVIMKNLIEKL